VVGVEQRDDVAEPELPVEVRDADHDLDHVTARTGARERHGHQVPDQTSPAVP
jgi:hypothetical protein